MPTALDHVNLHTHDPKALAIWYETILGLRQGPRSEIPVPGIWMYLGDTAVVHIVLYEHPMLCEAPSLEHFAFRAEGMVEFEDKLNVMNVPFDRQGVPGTNIVQFNLKDPMGNHFHVDFREGR